MIFPSTALVNVGSQTNFDCLKSTEDLMEAANQRVKMTDEIVISVCCFMLCLFYQLGIDSL